MLSFNNKFKSLLAVFILILITHSVNAQTIDYKSKCGAKIPKDNYSSIKIKSFSRSTKAGLPSFIDNSILKYFPPIFKQIGSSCSQAAGIGYLYTYEINLLLGREGKLQKNKLSYLSIWNYLNDGVGNCTYTTEGWDIIKANGIVSKSDFASSSSRAWCSGYNKNYKGMIYGIKEVAKFNAKTNPSQAIADMKQYLIDHGDGSPHGGIISFTANADPFPGSINYIDKPSDTGYRCVIHHFPKTGSHQMTIVGYDDKIEWDYNENGNIDADEKGAFICVNSWGLYWGDKGHFYMPYKVLSLSQAEGGAYNQFLIMNPKINTPKVVFKIKMEHSSRNDLSMRIGISKDKTATIPDKSIYAKIIRKQGGDLPMRGKYGSSYKEFEFALDADKLLDYIDKESIPAFFLKIYNRQNNKKGTGKLLSFSVLDYRLDAENPIEYKSSIENKTLGTSLLLKVTAQELSFDYKDDINISFKIPSEVNDESFFIMNLKSKTRVKIVIINSIGEIVQLISDKQFPIGKTKESWSPNDLSVGSYLMRISSYNQIFYKKIQIK